ncbi:MAG TPA: butyrate kinase [Bacteroidales bacterium]|nr:butyrate kinase [Bacteroidales bacterium]
MQEYYILSINPGSTSTKIAVYAGIQPVLVRNVSHSSEDLATFTNLTEQYHYRKNIIYRELEEAQIPMDLIRAVVGRGGLLRPIPSGVYKVNEKMKADLRNSPMGEHASNLGGLIADDIARSLPDAKAYIADPVVVDELQDVARVAGHPDFKRVSIFHALNQKAVARSHAISLLRKYEELNLIVVHLGGGITIGAHQKGKVIDVNQGLDGEGPFSPERSGTLPSGDLIRACFSGKYTEKQLLKMVLGEGGFVAHLGTNSAWEVEQRMKAGDTHATFIFDAMAYQVSKYIGAMFTVLHCQCDGILITGGIAKCSWFVNRIMERVHRLAPIFVYPGEDEMRALAINGLMVLKGEVEPLDY